MQECERLETEQNRTEQKTKAVLDVGDRKRHAARHEHCARNMRSFENWTSGKHKHQQHFNTSTNKCLAAKRYY